MKRAICRLGVCLGWLGFALCVVGLAAAWVYYPVAKEKTEQIYTKIDETLEVTDDHIQIAQKAVWPFHHWGKKRKRDVHHWKDVSSWTSRNWFSGQDSARKLSSGRAGQKSAYWLSQDDAIALRSYFSL